MSTKTKIKRATAAERAKAEHAAIRKQIKIATNIARGAYVSALPPGDRD